MSRLSMQLRADEKVLWSGKPVKMPFIFSGLAGIPVGVVFIVFAIFWTMTAAQGGAPLPFLLFGLLFVCIGFGVSLGSPLMQLLRYNNTEYMLTDQRIMIQTGVFGLDTRFVELSKIQEVYVNVGFIDRIFGTGSVYVQTAGSGYMGRFMSPSLVSLKDPYEVQKLLQVAVGSIVVNCSKCGAVNPAGSRVCSHCGNIIARSGLT